MATTKSSTKEAPAKMKSMANSEKSTASKNTAKSNGKTTSSASKKSATAITSDARTAGKKASNSGAGKSSATKSAGDAKNSGSKSSATRNAPTTNKEPRSSASKSNTSTRDHDTIRKWVEERGGFPAMVKGTGRKNEGAGILRIDFPGYSGEDSLQKISWDDFFRKFDESKLEFLYQEKTGDGEMSRFSKFVSSN